VYFGINQLYEKLITHQAVTNRIILPFNYHINFIQNTIYRITKYSDLIHNFYLIS